MKILKPFQESKSQSQMGNQAAYEWPGVQELT